MSEDPPGWYRHVSKREGALFLHNPTTGESVWFKGWVKRKSKMYARDYWFKPTTGRAEWELPVEASSLEPKVLPKGEDVVSSREKPSNDKVKGWMAKIRAAKAAAEAKRVSGEADGVLGKVRKRQDDGSSGDDMDVDNDTDGGDDLPVSSASVVGAPPLPSLPHQRAPGVPQAPPASPMHLGSAREDSPYVAVRRETLRKECLRRFADENSRLGAMRGYSKTSRSCREEGMAPPDPVFPGFIESDERLIKELKDGERSVAQAERVLNELGSACLEAAAELEALLETQQLRLKEQVVTLHEEITTSKAETRLQAVTGKGCRFPGPNPNSSYALRFVPSPDTGERETCLTITGTHLRKTWMAYCRVVHGATVPMWDSDFLRRLFCVLSRYETLSATSDGYQMAFPQAGFTLLQELLGIECECFASPLNCTLPRFCSVAYDTDRFFGSEGNFFLSKYREGSFEANPPFVEEVIERMVDHMHHLLERATGPMSFTIIVPGWNDSESYRKMMESSYARPRAGFHLTLQKGDHNYRPGMQHRQEIEEKPSNCNTFLFVLQNEEGARRWPVDATSLQNMQTKLISEARKHGERNLPRR